MHFRLTFGGWIYLISLTSLCGAATTGPKSPEALAEKSLAALKQNRLMEFAGFIHADERKRLKEFILLIIDKAAEKGEEKQILDFLGPRHTVKSVKGLGDQEFVAAFLSGMLRVQKDLKETLRTARFKALGHMLEGTDMHTLPTTSTCLLPIRRASTFQPWSA